MKALIIVSLALACLASPALDETRPVVSKEMIDEINSSQSTWVASDEWVGEMTVGEARQYANLIERPMEGLPVRNWGALSRFLTIPYHFDSREQWPNCVKEILNQGQCGSCWAFGAAESLSDRFCIASSASENVILSPQYLVSCDWGCFGCNGGYPDEAWLYMKLKGLPTLNCVSYHAENGHCPKTCDDGSALKFYHAENVHLYLDASSVQSAVLEHGPVETTMSVYEDFMSYKSGIYKHTTGKYLGGHAIKIVGWGTETSTGKKYYIVANSWGTDWGENGYFNIYVGNCGLGDTGVAGNPKLS